MCNSSNGSLGGLATIEDDICHVSTHDEAWVRCWCLNGVGAKSMQLIVRGKYKFLDGKEGMGHC